MAMPSAGISRRRRGSARLVNKSAVDVAESLGVELEAWAELVQWRSVETRQMQADGKNRIVVFISVSDSMDYSRIKPGDDQPICRRSPQCNWSAREGAIESPLPRICRLHLKPSRF